MKSLGGTSRPPARRDGLEARVWVDVARLHDDDLDVSDTFEPDTLAEARGLA